MYKSSFKALRAYIKSLITIPVYNATEDFKEEDNFCSIYNILTPLTAHNTLKDEYLEIKEDQTEVKIFEYKENAYLTARVDFRGDKAVENMAIFKNSFLMDMNNELLKEAGLGYLGFSNFSPIPLLRGVKAKTGMTITLKFFITEAVKDEAQIIKIFDIKVSKIN